MGMKTQMKVLLYLKKTEQSSDGFCPLMGKIDVKGNQNSVAQFSCKLNINPDIWNATSQRCLGKSRIATSANREIEAVLVLLRIRFNELVAKKDNVTAQEIKNAFQGIGLPHISLLGLFRINLNSISESIGTTYKESTYRGYCYSYSKISSFINTELRLSDIVIYALDESIIDKFVLYLRRNHICENTARTILEKIQATLNFGVDKGYITHNPVESYSPVHSKMKHRNLKEKEFSNFMGTIYQTPQQNFLRDVFVFSAFTGLAYCDIKKLTVHEIIKDDDGRYWLITHRQKTRSEEKVMLLDPAAAIFEKYRGIISEDQVFDIPCNSAVNRRLKVMAKQCGIKRNLSFHMARHTFATLICLQAGMPLEIVSKAMGHARVSTTERYAEVTDTKLIADAEALKNSTSDKYKMKYLNAPLPAKKNYTAKMKSAKMTGYAEYI